MNDPTFDTTYARQYGIVCGTDEAGRGPLAGPVVAAAVVLPDGLVIEGLDDSKKLSEKKRERLYDEILEKAAAYGIAQATHTEIDETNILAASLTAMRRAVAIVRETLTPDVILVDGNRSTDFGLPSISIVHGDALSQSIAAASVLAKVTRDRMCAEYEEKYPGYGFARHKGYPTPEHKLAIYLHGPCEIHRRTFLTFLTRDRDKLEAMRKERLQGEPL
ncbi:MAG: ribonuclease HII [Eubacteriales bacterium]